MISSVDACVGARVEMHVFDTCTYVGIEMVGIYRVRTEHHLPIYM